MGKEFSEYLKDYELRNSESYAALQYAITIMKTLLNQSYESYIIGPAIRKIIEGVPNKEFDIYTSAPSPVILTLFKDELIGDGILTVIHNECIYHINNFVSDYNDLRSGNMHFDRKLAATIENKMFTCDSLAMSPKCIVTDLFHGIEDIEQKTIRTISKPRTLAKEHPEYVIKSFVVMAKLNYSFHTSLKRAIFFNHKVIQKVNPYEMVKAFKEIIGAPYEKETFKYLVKTNALLKCAPYDNYVSRINRHNNLSDFYKIMMLYLLLEDIPDIKDLSEVEAGNYREYISITKLLLDAPVTPMMVYHIGAKTLISCDTIAKTFNRKYHSQKHRINKFESSLVIKNIRDFKITPLEIISIFKGERSLKNKIVINKLLEKVINGEIENESYILRQEALKLADEIDKVFKATPSMQTMDDSEENIKALEEKYQKDIKFLVDVYLSDHSGLYNLLPKERIALVEDAKKHAKEFLISTGQYMVLERRGLLND